MKTDTQILEWLTSQVVDVIYLDDGRIIDVKAGDVRRAIERKMEAEPIDPPGWEGGFAENH